MLKISELFKSKKEKEAIQMMVDYVEGRLDVNSFKVFFDTDVTIVNLLKSKIYKAYLKYYNYSVYEYLNRNVINWNTIDARYRIQIVLMEFLSSKNVNFNKTSVYEEALDYLLDIQPSWLDCVEDQGLFDKLLEEMPKDLSKTKRIAWGKARIKELFKYDKTYPRWVQSPEWPIVNGKPLVFSHQKRAGKGDERTYYYFYDPDTKEETVVTQFY